MLNKTRNKLATAPTPIAGLALGIASLGWCWENTGLFAGEAQKLGAVLASVLLLLLVAKFIFSPRLLITDLAHPVVGSVVPTFAMATMVITKAMSEPLESIIWLFAIALHLFFLIIFVWHRLKGFRLHHLVPSWFIPPVGILIADLTCPGGDLLILAEVILWFGLTCYGLMLPIMLYRLIFCSEVPDAAKPTLAIMAAPASLCLTAYLTIVSKPEPLLVVVLLGIALLMTALIYLAFIKLLRLPFSPAYAAFTFPLVVGATALFKVAERAEQHGLAITLVNQLHHLALVELSLATLVVFYVGLRFMHYFKPFNVKAVNPSLPVHFFKFIRNGIRK